MIGILRTSIPGHASLTPGELLHATARLGLDALMVASPLDVSPTLAAHELADFRRRATDLGITLGSGIGWLSPLRPERMAGALEHGHGDVIAGLTRIIEAVADLGVSNAFFQIGSLEDRFGDAPAWSAHLASAAEALARLRPVLQRTGVRLLLKTHEEITTQEILHLVERTGEVVLGVALDPVNVLVRMEDPVEATRRVARHVAQVHLDDAQLRRDAGMLRRILCPLGDGCLDWPAILAQVKDKPVWLELHRGQFSMPAFDAGWLAEQPDLDPMETRRVIAMADRLAKGREPDQSDPFARLPQLIAVARTLTGNTPN
jgi:sugar phosphate isomerase/epimerase